MPTTDSMSRPRMAAIYAPGTAQATCPVTVRPRAGRPAPTSRMFIPSRAAPCRVPCGGLLRRRNDASTRSKPFRPGPGGFKNPGAAVAAPGVQGQQPHQKCRCLRGGSGGGVEGIHPTEAAKQISRATVARCFGPNGTAQLGTARHAMPDGRPWTWDVVELPSDLSACLPNLSPSRPYRVL